MCGIGYGVVMPGIIKAVIGDIDERHAGLAASMVMTALQIGSALGIAIVGGFFYISLGARTGLQAYARAFSNSMAMNVALLVLGCALSMPSRRETNYSCALTVLKTQTRHFNGKETMSSPNLHYATLLEASDPIRTRKVSLTVQ